MNAYSVLGVTETATRAEIRAAYRARARELHPDRHRASDGTVPAQANAAWLELTEALHAALAAAAAVPALPGGLVPRQRSTAATSPRRFQPPARPVPADPMLLLLTLPRDCREAWSSDELAVWALSLVPAARRHLGDARRFVVDLRIANERHRSAATAHVLLTLTVALHDGRKLRAIAHRLPSAYDALERHLPAVVVDRLPSGSGTVARRPGRRSLPWLR